MFSGIIIAFGFYYRSPLRRFLPFVQEYHSVGTALTPTTNILPRYQVYLPAEALHDFTRLRRFTNGFEIRHLLQVASTRGPLGHLDESTP